MSSHSLTERAMQLFHPAEQEAEAEVPTIYPTAPLPTQLHTDDAQRLYWAQIIMVAAGILSAIGFVLVALLHR